MTNPVWVNPVVSEGHGVQREQGAWSEGKDKRHSIQSIALFEQKSFGGRGQSALLRNESATVLPRYVGGGARRVAKRGQCRPTVEECGVSAGSKLVFFWGVFFLRTGSQCRKDLSSVGTRIRNRSNRERRNNAGNRVPLFGHGCGAECKVSVRSCVRTCWCVRSCALPARLSVARSYVRPLPADDGNAPRWHAVVFADRGFAVEEPQPAHTHVHTGQA
ncbi:hypothetical protein ZHAS_00009199 [Anopheles sinensis]|uniref:Uncharacterized protein n=1 Tax=Anopheles sinensis TaxID=74873 RepID=A0A084VUF1_ANOSI|nr:hypothetical protein ZHAS_00009199 [Anopheles sinensis]